VWGDQLFREEQRKFSNTDNQKNGGLKNTAKGAVAEQAKDWIQGRMKK